jgi:hypothetical protein
MDENEKLAQQIEEERGSFGKPAEETKAEGEKETKETSPAPETETSEETKIAEVAEESKSEEVAEETEEAGETKETDAAEETEETSEEDVSKELTKKTGVQKRINRLIAEIHQLKSQIEAKPKEEAEKERVYSEEELSKAERKAIDDEDTALLSEVFKERLKNERRELIKMYREERETQTQAIVQKQQEWASIVERYSDDDDPSLDIRKPTSDLFKLAKTYYEDPDLKKEYAGAGGMLKAAADAFSEIIKLRSKKKVPADAKKAERKSAKEKLKNSLAAPSGEKTVKAKETKSEDSFSDYIKEREADRLKKMGT